jgi:hydroxypyruvate reductase
LQDLEDSRRRVALELLKSALAQVEGRRCVREALRARPRDTRPPWVAAVGKAASSMALGAFDALLPERALVITKDGHVEPELTRLPGVEIHESAHPVPDQRSLAAGQRLLDWVDELREEVQPLFLISGGASSLVEVLEPGVSFADLSRLTRQGLAEGIGIHELNARRSQLSRIKGGRLTARLHGRAALALFLSDVPGDDPAVIGSGLLGPSDPDAVDRLIVGSIEHALAAAAYSARQVGLTAQILPGRFDLDAEQVAAAFVEMLIASPAQVVLWGGESTVLLPSRPGRGGRNQHLALAAARLIARHPDLMVLAAGTDGTDGPTEDAGALVDAGTCERVELSGLGLESCLGNADSGSALAASGDLLQTGPTGTNVGDLLIGLKLAS